MQAGKMDIEALGKVLLLLAFLIIAITIISTLFKGCVEEERNKVYTNEAYWCWGTNLVRSEIPLFPTTCKPIIVEEAVGKEEVSEMLKACWWMYGQNEWDLGTKEKNFIKDIFKEVLFAKNYMYICYLFQPKEDIQLNELRNYMEENKKGKETDWEYIEGKGEGSNICFDNEDRGVLREGKVYYVKFYDDRNDKVSYDKLIISSDSEFAEDKQRAIIFLKWAGHGILEILSTAEIVGIDLNPCYRIGKTPQKINIVKEEEEKIKGILAKIVNAFKKCKNGESCACGFVSLEGLKGKEVSFKQDGKYITISVSGGNLDEPETRRLIEGELCTYHSSVNRALKAIDPRLIPAESFDDIFNPESYYGFGINIITKDTRKNVIGDEELKSLKIMDDDEGDDLLIALYKTKNDNVCFSSNSESRLETYKEKIGEKGECVEIREWTSWGDWLRKQP